MSRWDRLFIRRKRTMDGLGIPADSVPKIQTAPLPSKQLSLRLISRRWNLSRSCRDAAVWRMCLATTSSSGVNSPNGGVKPPLRQIDPLP